MLQHVQPVGPGLLASHRSVALSARHLVHALGTVYEAPTFGKWVPAFIAFRALSNCPRGAQRSTSTSPSLLASSRLALARLSESAPQTCPLRDQRLRRCSCSLKMSVALMLPTKSYRVRDSAHNPGTLAGMLPRTPLQNRRRLAIQTATKLVSARPQTKTLLQLQQNDQGFEVHVFATSSGSSPATRRAKSARSCRSFLNLCHWRGLHIKHLLPKIEDP